MLKYRLIDPNDADDMQILAEWYNDRSIRHLSIPHPNKQAYRQRVTPDALSQSLEARASKTYRMYIIEWNKAPVAEMSLDLGSKQLKKTSPKSAWLGLVIGEDWARGVGLGKKIMKKLEAVALEMGATRVELGVFVFNVRAIRLYEKLGYKTFARTPKTTWWDGQFWDSLHMEKMLVED